jgi:hypothetical protein
VGFCGPHADSAGWVQVGYCPQRDPLLDLLTPREHLQLYARIKGVPEKNLLPVVEAKLRVNQSLWFLWLCSVVVWLLIRLSSACSIMYHLSGCSMVVLQKCGCQTSDEDGDPSLTTFVLVSTSVSILVVLRTSVSKF